MFQGVANLPWNSGWDGVCESCGVRFEHTQFTVGSYSVSEDGYSQVGVGGAPPPAGPDSYVGHGDHRPAAERLEPRPPRRSVTVRPVNIPLRTFIDEGIVLAGIELTVVHHEFGDDGPKESRVMLTLDELEQVRAAIAGPLSPVAEQWGWGVDDT